MRASARKLLKACFGGAMGRPNNALNLTSGARWRAWQAHSAQRLEAPLAG